MGVASARYGVLAKIELLVAANFFFTAAIGKSQSAGYYDRIRAPADYGILDLLFMCRVIRGPSAIYERSGRLEGTIACDPSVFRVSMSHVPGRTAASPSRHVEVGESATSVCGIELLRRRGPYLGRSWLAHAERGRSKEITNDT